MEENGAGLSLGTRQKIALARAVYHQRDVYLLDEPLSDVPYKVCAFVYVRYVCLSVYVCISMCEIGVFMCLMSLLSDVPNKVRVFVYVI